MSLPKTYVSGFHNEEKVKSMPYKRLGETDMELSRLSLGGAAFSRLYSGLNDEEVIGTIKEAFQSGINYIDTAPYYGEGHSETLVGKGLKNVPRESFYISTKVGRYTCKYETMFDYSREKIHSRFETSLQLLGVKYVDIAVVHDVEFAADLDQVLNEALPAVEELVKSGKVRYIAISGYPVSKLWEVVQKSKVKIDIVLSYSRETLIDTTLSKYADKFKSKGVGIINAAPLAMQMLTNKGPEVWHPANDDIKKLCLNASQYCKEKGVELGLLAIYHSMVKDYPTCLVGCNSKKILESNLNLVFQGLSQLEKDVLKHLKEKYFTLNEDLHWEGVEVSAYRKYMESIKK